MNSAKRLGLRQPSGALLADEGHNAPEVIQKFNMFDGTFHFIRAFLLRSIRQANRFAGPSNLLILNSCRSRLLRHPPLRLWAVTVKTNRKAGRRLQDATDA